MTRPDGTPDPCTYGAGYLNIPAALACPLTLGLPALSPTLSVDDSGDVLLNPLHITWGDTTGGTHITWGDNGTGATHITWGDTSIGGTHITWGDMSIGGTHITWGDTVGQGDIWGQQSFLGASNALLSSPLLSAQPVWTDPSVWSAAATAADISQTAANGEN